MRTRTLTAALIAPRPALSPCRGHGTRMALTAVAIAAPALQSVAFFTAVGARE
jgi:hypothetical protein